RRIERREPVKALPPRSLVIKAHTESQVELAGHLVVVVNVGGAEVSVERGEGGNEEVRGLHLPKQERGERIAGARQNVAVRIVSAAAETAEVEATAGRRGPAVEIELVMPELVSNLDRVLALDPR